MLKEPVNLVDVGYLQAQASGGTQVKLGYTHDLIPASERQNAVEGFGDL